jgi:hypothetical protein
MSFWTMMDQDKRPYCNEIHPHNLAIATMPVSAWLNSPVFLAAGHSTNLLSTALWKFANQCNKQRLAIVSPH